MSDFEQMWRDCHARNSILWQELNGHHALELVYKEALREVRVLMTKEPLTRTNKALKVVRRIDRALASNQDKRPLS